MHGSFLVFSGDSDSWSGSVFFVSHDQCLKRNGNVGGEPTCLVDITGAPNTAHFLHRFWAAAVLAHMHIHSTFDV